KQLIFLIFFYKVMGYWLGLATKPPQNLMESNMALFNIFHRWCIPHPCISALTFVWKVSSDMRVWHVPA
ncbi:hypothetical protein P3381_24945, partial [Vibrio parahaemolyticus]|nr:hypothetical protein [Vibrio parahaemolyticus]